MRLGLTSRFAGPGLALLAFVLFSTHDVIVKLLGGSYSPVQIVFFQRAAGSCPSPCCCLMRDRTDGNLLPRYPGWTALRTGAAVLTGVSVFYAFSVLPMAADICDLVRNTAADNRAFGAHAGRARGLAAQRGGSGRPVRGAGGVASGDGGGRTGAGSSCGPSGRAGGRDCLDHRAQDRRGRAQRRFAVIPNDGQSGRDGSGASLCLPPDAVGRSWRACGHGGAGAGGQLGGDRRI